MAQRPDDDVAQELLLRHARQLSELLRKRIYGYRFAARHRAEREPRTGGWFVRLSARQDPTLYLAIDNYAGLPERHFWFGFWSRTPQPIADLIDRCPLYLKPKRKLVSTDIRERKGHCHMAHPLSEDESRYPVFEDYGDEHGFYYGIYDTDSQVGIDERRARDFFMNVLGPQPDPKEAAFSADPKNITDACDRIIREIKARRGQQQFRDELVRIYGRRCAITGCNVLDVLEAVHVTPYRRDATNVVDNGLLLRTDLHTLLDCGLLAIEPKTRTVCLARSIRNTPDYKALHGQPLRDPEPASCRLSQDALESAWGRYSDFDAASD